MRARLGIFLAGLLWLTTPVAAKDLHFATEEFFPFSYAMPDPATGQAYAAGPLVDTVQLVCGRLEIRCNVTIFPWRRATSLAEQGEVDGIFAITRSPERERAFYITQMLVKSAHVTLARSSDPYHYQSPADLAGRTIGVYGPSGSSQALTEMLSQAPGARMHVVTDNLLLLRMLSSGRFGTDGLAMINQDVARNLIESEGLTGIRETAHRQPVAYGIGFSRKAVSFGEFQAFQNTLQDSVRDGSVQQILRAYALEPIN